MSSARYQRERLAQMPPSRCHPDRKEHAGGWCRSCYRIEGKRAARATCHPGRLQVAHGLCQGCYNAQPAVKAKLAALHRAKKYGLSREQFDQLVALHQGLCAICGEPGYAVDHDHATGVIRGWLCGNCNSGLGMFRDNPELMRRGALYIEGDRPCKT